MMMCWAKEEEAGVELGPRGDELWLMCIRVGTTGRSAIWEIGDQED